VKLKTFLLSLGGLAYAYALVSVFAQGFWAGIFDAFVNVFNLTYAEGNLLIPVIPTILCTATGIASAFFFVRNIRSKNSFSPSSENFSGFFCFSAFLFYAAVNIHSASLYPQMVSNIRIEQTGRAAYETGRVLDGQYANDFYGFNLQIPAGWSNIGWTAMEREKAHATLSLFSSQGKNISPKDLIPQHFDGVNTLATIQKYSPPNGSYNPSLVIEAHDKRVLEKYGVSNLLDFARWCARVPPPFIVDGSPRPANIAGRTAFLLKIISHRNRVSINQKMFLFETHSSYLEFVASSIDEADASNLLASVDTVKFTK
jgi:hypothetical protein